MSQELQIDIILGQDQLALFFTPERQVAPGLTLYKTPWGRIIGGSPTVKLIRSVPLQALTHANQSQESHETTDEPVAAW